MRKATLKGYIETTTKKQHDWLRDAFLKELGEDFYGKSDEVIAEEAKKRKYTVIYKPCSSVHELRNKDGIVISTFNINL